MKKAILILAGITLSILVVILFLCLPVLEKATDGFNRNFRDVRAEFLAVQDLGNNSSLILCEAKNGVMIKNYKNIFEITTCQFPVKHYLKSKLEPLPNFRANAAFSNATTYKNTLFITNSLGQIIRYRPRMVPQLFTLDSTCFDQACAISSDLIIARLVYWKNNERRRKLVRINVSDNPKIDREYDLPKTVDGFFCTDGWLYYDQLSQTVLYSYYYKGVFDVLDTNLIMVNSIKTIDTVNTVKVNLTKTTIRINDSITGLKTSEAHNRLINYNYTTHKGLLYVLSKQRANNEITLFMTKQQVVDVYSLKSGYYVGSFYLPSYKGNLPRQIVVMKDKVAGIYKSNLVWYRLNGKRPTAQLARR